MWDYLEPVARMLEPLTIVHRFDQRGCGGSTPSSLHTVARYLADIEALRQHWRHKSWIVLGHSFGATLALAYAFAHPEHTAAMGYMSGVGVGDWQSLYRAERLRRMTDEQRKRMADLKARPVRSQAEEVEFRTLSWFTDYADPDRGWELALTDARAEMEINFEANRMLNAETGAWTPADILAQAKQLRMPCWFFHGAADPRPVSTVADLAHAIPQSRLHLIQLAGHAPWRERPDDLRELLHQMAAANG